MRRRPPFSQEYQPDPAESHVAGVSQSGPAGCVVWSRGSPGCTWPSQDRRSCILPIVPTKNAMHLPRHPFRQRRGRRTKPSECSLDDDQAFAGPLTIPPDALHSARTEMELLGASCLKAYSGIHIDRPPRISYAHGAWSTGTSYTKHGSLPPPLAPTHL